MGFGAAVAGGMIMSLVVIVASVSMSSLLHTNETVSQASNQRSMIESDYSKTAIQITSVQATASNKTILLDVQNTGSKKLWNFANFNVLVEYPFTVQQGNTTVVQHRTENLAYAGLAVPSSVGSWGISSFVNDNFDPQILNPGESMQITCVLSNPLAAANHFLVTVVTDNGVEATRSMEVT